MFTAEEETTIRTAVFGAMVLVSTADPGFVDQESYAGISAMRSLSPNVRIALSAARPTLPEGGTEDVERGVLAALRESVRILSVKAPDEARTFPDAVVAICREVADADGEVAWAETAMVSKVEAALNG